MIREKKSFFWSFFLCKKGFSLIETSIVLAIAGCFLGTVIYQGSEMMEKATHQKMQKEIARCVLCIEQWRGHASSPIDWDDLSENGLDAKNIQIWQRAIQEGALSQNQLHKKHNVPFVGKGAYLSIVRQNGTIALAMGGISGSGTKDPVFSAKRAEHLLNALQESGIYRAKKEGAHSKFWIWIPMD